MGATLLLADRQQNDNLIVYNSGELSRFLLVICFVSTNETVKESSEERKEQIFFSLVCQYVRKQLILLNQDQHVQN